MSFFRSTLLIAFIFILSACSKNDELSEKNQVLLDRFWESRRLGKYSNPNSSSNFYYQIKGNGVYIYGSNTSSFQGNYRMIDPLTFQVINLNPSTNVYSYATIGMFNVDFNTFTIEGEVYNK